MNKQNRADLGAFLMENPKSLVDNRGNPSGTGTPILGTAPATRSSDFGSTCKFSTDQTVGGRSASGPSKPSAGKIDNSDMGDGSN